MCSGTTRRWRWPSRAISPRSRRSTIAWTSSPPSRVRRRKCASTKRAVARAPTSSSPAGRASTRRSAASTRTSSPSRAASIPPISPVPGGRPTEPADQAAIPHPRLGFFGVIDERMDLDLLADVADARPDWQLVLIGPVVKIDPAPPAAAREHPLPRQEGLCRSCRRTSRGGTWRSCRSRSMNRRASSARRRRRNTSRRASPSSRRRSAMSCGPTEMRGLVHIAATAGDFVQAIAQALRRG